MRRADRGASAAGLLTSVLVHAGLAWLIWYGASSAEAMPELRVYAVDIVSPPPQQQGEPDPGVAAPEEEPVEEVAEPEPEPVQETAPPAPARRQPEPEPRREPVRKPDIETPAREPARPSTGAEPDPSSEGGENLEVKFDGVRCIDPDYCGNIIRQIHRYFRRPSSGAAGEADLYFVIQSDGSVDGLRVINSSGGLSFRLAVMEAVEQAGRNKAFGELPRAFGGTLPVRFTFRPAR